MAEMTTFMRLPKEGRPHWEELHVNSSSLSLLLSFAPNHLGPGQHQYHLSPPPDLQKTDPQNGLKNNKHANSFFPSGSFIFSPQIRTLWRVGK